MKNYDPLSFVTGEKQEAPCAWKTSRLRRRLPDP